MTTQIYSPVDRPFGWSLSTLLHKQELPFPPALGGPTRLSTTRLVYPLAHPFDVTIQIFSPVDRPFGWCLSALLCKQALPFPPALGGPTRLSTTPLVYPLPHPFEMTIQIYSPVDRPFGWCLPALLHK